MIAIGSDHAGFVYKEKIKSWMDSNRISYHDAGTNSSSSCDYPLIAQDVCTLVKDGSCERGILVCGTGIGMCIAANKISGIRAALCHDTFTARLTRTHNDANILCLGERVLGIGVVVDIVSEFLRCEFEGGRHIPRLKQIEDLEKQNIL